MQQRCFLCLYLISTTNVDIALNYDIIPIYHNDNMYGYWVRFRGIKYSLNGTI